MIESVNNERVKTWCKLKEKKYRDLTDSFLIFGDHLLECALSSGIVKEIIALDDSFKKNNIPYTIVSTNVMKKLSNEISVSKVCAVCSKLDKKDIASNVVILDNIQDPGNLGTIIRSAVAFNIGTIIMSKDTVDLYNEKVIRASEGMIFKLNFIKDDLEHILPILISKGYKIYGTNVEKGNDLKRVDFNEKNGIILGNEGQGMNRKLQDYCDNLINIKISSNCESLNVAIAASIIFYEMERR